MTTTARTPYDPAVSPEEQGFRLLGGVHIRLSGLPGSMQEDRVILSPSPRVRQLVRLAAARWIVVDRDDVIATSGPLGGQGTWGSALANLVYQEGRTDGAPIADRILAEYRQRRPAVDHHCRRCDETWEGRFLSGGPADLCDDCQEG